MWEFGCPKLTVRLLILACLARAAATRNMAGIREETDRDKEEGIKGESREKW